MDLLYKYLRNIKNINIKSLFNIKDVNHKACVIGNDYKEIGDMRENVVG